jgi:ubiquinone/menaquinone biosynthesis C-methylase UbiE
MNYNEITIETYNKIAKEYAEKVRGLVPMNELEKFVNYMPREGLVLDIGCGSGVAAKNLYEKGLQVFGIDLSMPLIEEAKKESPKSFFEKMDMKKMVYVDNSFDGIWNVASLLHLEKKDVPTALSEAYRVLKPEGVMYLSIKEGEGESLEKDERYNGFPKYYSYYTEDEINNLLEDSGFQVLENYTVRYKDNYRIAHPWMNIFARKNE